MIRHHPSDATLVAYAAATLPAPHRQVVAVHLAQCSVCRETLRLGVALGGALLDAQQPAPMAEHALARALTRLDELVPETPQERSAAPADATTLAALSRGGRWRRAGRGIAIMRLARRDRTRTRLDLIRVDAGLALPRHEHTGLETTCVLEGAFVDETGEYRAGDVHEGDVGLDHQPISLAGKACVCIIATTGSLRARSLIARLLLPVFGL